MKFYDLTLPIYPEMTIYPGNTQVVFDQIQKIPDHSCNSTTVTMGTHTGTHIDAPRHVSNSGATVDELPLECLIGPCRVLDFSTSKEKISLADLQRYQFQAGDKILCKTNNSDRGWDTFYDNYIYLDGDAAEYLATIPVSLVGIDYLSIKQRGSLDHRPHTALLNNNILILESINLRNIPEGDYFLLALPLKLSGLDGSPARVVLTDISME